MTSNNNVARIQIERESLKVMSQDDIDRMAKKE